MDDEPEDPTPPLVLTERVGWACRSGLSWLTREVAGDSQWLRLIMFIVQLESISVACPASFKSESLDGAVLRPHLWMFPKPSSEMVAGFFQGREDGQFVDHWVPLPSLEVWAGSEGRSLSGRLR